MLGGCKPTEAKCHVRKRMVFTSLSNVNSLPKLGS